MFDLMPYRKRSGREMVSFRDEMDNLFNRFFDMDFPVSWRLFKDGEWAPRLDVVDGKGKITVKAEIPGCEAKDIDVKLDGRMLTISGEKKQEKEEKDKKFHRVERFYGSFMRSFTLPDNVDESKIEASFKDGMLNLTIPKIEATKPKAIDVKIK